MAKQVKNNKEQIRLEFPIKASPKIIYSMLTSPSGLSEWFCDDVNIRNKEFDFKWNGSVERALLLSQKENVHIKWKWDDGSEDSEYFEIRIEVDELTNDVALIVTDHADADEKASRILYWDNLIHKLMHAVGS